MGQPLMSGCMQRWTRGSRDMETGDAGGETPSHRFAFGRPGSAGDDKAVRRFTSLFESEGIGKPLDLEGFSPSLGSANLPSQLLTMGFVPGAISVSNGSRTSSLSRRLEQQFEMVARPRNHFYYNSLTVTV
jgi:hypothetical protein